MVPKALHNKTPEDCQDDGWISKHIRLDIRKAMEAISQHRH